MGSVIGYPEAHGAAATFETDIEDKVKSLIVNVEPVQDLHGYDHPWPAGGGKNLIPLSLEDIKAANTNGTWSGNSYTYNGLTFTLIVNKISEIIGITVNGTNANSAAANLYLGPFNSNTHLQIVPGNNYYMSGGASNAKMITWRYDSSGAYINLSGNSSTQIGALINNSASVTQYTPVIQVARGVTVQSETVYPMVYIGTSQAPPFEPYSNPCPITGWTGAKMIHSGKNLAQYWKQAYIGADGTIKSGSSYALTKPIFVQVGKPVSISNTAGDYQGIAVFSDESLGNMIYRLANTASTYIASQDCYVVCWFNKVYSEYVESDFINRGAQIEFNYSPTKYEPYSSDEYDITFPSAAGTVYGGTLDVVKGELVVDKILYTNLQSRTWEVETTENGYVFSCNALTNTNAKALNYNFICNKYKNAGTYKSKLNNGEIGCYNNTNGRNRFSICDNAYDNVADFKVSLSDCVVCYELATPITYQLTPQEINTIIGTNTIYADTGDVSVLYPKTLTPAETVSNVSLMELRRNIMIAMQYNYIPEITAYGVEWNYNDPSTVLKRTGAASKFANPIPAESLNEVGWSPFDNVYPWSEMKRYNIINGEVAYSEDDAGYSETLYDTMVYIPEFYYYAYKDTSNQKWNWSISSKPLEGYEKHPGSGCYVGRFHTSGSSSGVFSKSGMMPLTDITCTNFRTYSKNKGNKWRQLDIKTWSAIQILYLVEFANWNSQLVLGKGNDTNNMHTIGETGSSKYHTIKRTVNSNSYRWIENPYSNGYCWSDGYIANYRSSYITTDQTIYGGDLNDYTLISGVSLPNSNYITNFNFYNQCKWAFIPSSSDNTNGESYVTDYVFTHTGADSSNSELHVGGSFSGNNYFGMFCFSPRWKKDTKSEYIGSRLIFQS